MKAPRWWQLALGFVLSAGLARAEAPFWLKAAASIPTPASAAGAPAVVLLDETTMEIDAAGAMVETHHYALRVLHEAGRKHARGEAIYNGASSRVTEAGAWLLRDGRQTEERLSRQWADVSAEAAGAAVDEMRMRVLNLSDQALNGDVFGYEIQVAGPLTVGQLWLEFGGMLPCVQSSTTITLPEDFGMSEQVFGPVKPETALAGTHQKTWTVAGQPYRPAEPNDAGAGRIDAAVLIGIKPSDAALRKFKPPRFSSWADVTALCDNLNAPQCDTNPAIAARTRELVARAGDSVDKIRRIGAYVQQLRYIAFNRGLRYGHGWRARKATEVFSTGYGDCKDKANLMVAMLREAGIKAHLVIARLDADRVVRPEFPSPIQFNHAIVAIPVGDDVKLPAVVPVAGHGAVLFFDPTDPYSQVGDLSVLLQGSSVFLVAPGVSALTLLPVFSAEDAFRTERQVTLEVTASGELTMSGRIVGRRQAGARLRAAFHEAGTPQELDKLVTAQLNARLKAASILERKTEDDQPGDRSTLSFRCVQPGYMQLSASATPVLKLDVLSRGHIPSLAENQRRLPVELLPAETVDEVTVHLPDGFLAGEVPADFALQSEFGAFSIAYRTDPERITLSRRLVLNRKLVPVEAYPRLRQFLADIARADRNSVMLKRQVKQAAN